MDPKPLKEIWSKLSSCKEVAILTHKSPDGDAIGSVLAMKMALQEAGVKTRIFNRHEVPQVYRFLPGWEEIEVVEKLDPASLPGCVLVLDASDFERVSLFHQVPEDTTVVLIDHHRPREPFGDLRLVDTSSASTGELVLRLLEANGVKISPDMALALYTAVFTDTGGFRYPNTSAEALYAGYKLASYGADPTLVPFHVYSNYPGNRHRLLGLSLNTLGWSEDGLVAWMEVTLEMFRETGTKAEDTEDFVDFPRSIKGVEVALFFREREVGGVKVSLRSKSWMNVAAVASLFGGGGHRNAAGCEIDASLEEAKSMVKEEVFKALSTKG